MSAIFQLQHYECGVICIALKIGTQGEYCRKPFKDFRLNQFCWIIRVTSLFYIFYLFNIVLEVITASFFLSRLYIIP